MKIEFFRCTLCGNVVVKIIDSGADIKCCGQTMELLLPHETENGMEKHLPVVARLNHETVQVSVGSAPHPMTPEHHIRMICLVTPQSSLIAMLSADDAPQAIFHCPEEPIAAFALCNIHDLWKLRIS